MDWKQQFEEERARLVEALGKVTEGGIIESIQHIGATSLPGVQDSSCVDIGLAVWPFPLEDGSRSRLEAMGYQVVQGVAERPGQRFRHTSGAFQLFFFESGLDNWYNFTLISDYLRQDDRARHQFRAKKADPSANKAVLFAELLPEAHAWWIESYGFSPLEEITNELQEAPFEWYVSGGWALDLFLGRVERLHHDVDVIVPRAAQLDVQTYLTQRGWKLVTPFEKRLETWPPHMRLELPRHQVHAHRGDSFLDLLLTDMDGVWRYRREPTILRSKEKMGLRSAAGIPYLAPEVVLLFKSKNTSNQERLKDQSDFEKVLPHLEPERGAWLYWALTAISPDHPWIPRLAP